APWHVWAARALVVRGEARQCRALVGRQKFRQQRPAVRVQVLSDPRPIEADDAVVDVDDARVLGSRGCTHVVSASNYGRYGPATHSDSCGETLSDARFQISPFDQLRVSRACRGTEGRFQIGLADFRFGASVFAPRVNVFARAVNVFGRGVNVYARAPDVEPRAPRVGARAPGFLTRVPSFVASPRRF